MRVFTLRIKTKRRFESPDHFARVLEDLVLWLYSTKYSQAEEYPGDVLRVEVQDGEHWLKSLG